MQCPCSTGKHAPVHANGASGEGKRAPCGTAPATPSLGRPAGQCCQQHEVPLGGRKPGCTCCQAHRKSVRTWVQSARVGGAARRARLHRVHHSMTSRPSAEATRNKGIQEYAWQSKQCEVRLTCSAAPAGRRWSPRGRSPGPTGTRQRATAGCRSAGRCRGRQAMKVK